MSAAQRIEAKIERYRLWLRSLDAHDLALIAGVILTRPNPGLRRTLLLKELDCTTAGLDDGIELRWRSLRWYRRGAS